MVRNRAGRGCGRLGRCLRQRRARRRRQEVLGLILVKELILWDHTTRTEVGRLKLRSMPLLRADTRLYDMLRLFETCRCHMALLVRPRVLPASAEPAAAAPAAARAARAPEP